MRSRNGPRVAIIGTTGSGKTTLARKLAATLSLRHVELDRLHWRSGWVQAPLEEFRYSVASALAAEAWVADGNYGKVRDIVWGRATHVVWLDLPFLLVLWRLTWRTVRRGVSRERLFGDNRESLLMSFLSRDSIIWWMLLTYERHRRQYPRLFEMPEHTHLRIITVRTRADARRLLRTLEAYSPARPKDCGAIVPEVTP